MSDHWRRDQPQFFNIFDLGWGKADGPPALHGVEARVVTRNPETGEGTYMVNLPAGGRHTETADSPDHSIATTGPEVMNSSRSGKKGLSRCSA